MADWRVVSGGTTTALAAGWWAVMAIVRVAWACRAAVLSVAVGFGLIAFTDQARDIVIASGPPSLTGKSGIFVAVLIWAVTAWYWARTTLGYDFACPLPGPNAPRWQTRWQRFWAAHMPRIIGALGILSVAFAFHKAQSIYSSAGDIEHASAFGSDAWRYAAYAVAFYILVWVRRPLMLFLVQHARLIGSPEIANWLVPAVAPTPRLWFANPLALAVLILSLLASPLFYFLVARDPVGLSAFFRGAVPAVLFGLALIVPVTSALVIVSARWRFPLFGLVLVWFLAAPGIVGDLHDVRTLRSLATSGDITHPYRFDDSRPPLKQAFIDWWRANRAITTPIASTEVVAPPMVVVATAGGASRAAFWTTQVLGEIARREAHFADRLFMVSGVSGGSLGAVTFRSIVEADRRASPDGAGSPLLPRAAHDGASVIENDFLGPALTMGLYVDLPSAIGLPFLLPRSWRPDDRAAALEKAWGQAWADEKGRIKGADRFAWSDGFTAVFGGARPWPLLALNGTSVEKGKRIITSNARFWAGAATNPQNLSGGVNRYDTFDITRSDIPISTAVTMSARFPVISPSGALKDETGKLWGRVTDGGLFENFGAMTADEVLRYLVSRISEVQNGDYPIVPIAILISSDPGLDQLLLRRDGVRNPAPPDCRPTAENARPVPVPHPGNGWPECPVDPSKDARLLVDPVLALYDGRVARGEAAATALFDRMTDFRLLVRDRLLDHGVPDVEMVRTRLGLDDHTDFFHFRQCRLARVKSPTMSWHDSAEAWSAMRQMLGLDKDASGAVPDPCGNQAEFFRLCVRLARLGGQAPDDQAATDACATHWPKPRGWTCTVEHDGRRPYCRLE